MKDKFWATEYFKRAAAMTVKMPAPSAPPVTPAPMAQAPMLPPVPPSPPAKM